MADYFVLALFFLVYGMFSADVVSVSVMEGDSVTLNSDVTKLQHNKMLWYYNDTRIALIGEDPNTSCLYDGEGGRFRDRLKVDYKSGSLTISDIRSEHTGRYEAELIRGESSGKRQSLNRNRKCDSTKITRKISNSTTDTIKTFSVTISGVSLERTGMRSQSGRTATEQKDPDKTNKESDKEKMKQESGKSSALSSGPLTGIVLLLVGLSVVQTI